MRLLISRLPGITRSLLFHRLLLRLTIQSAAVVSRKLLDWLSLHCTSSPRDGLVPHVVREFGGQTLEIGPDQRLGRWRIGPAVAAVQLRPQEDQELPVVDPLV